MTITTPFQKLTTRALRNETDLPIEWFALPSPILKPYILGYRGLIIPNQLPKAFVQISPPTARTMLYIVFGSQSTTQITLPGSEKGKPIQRSNHSLILPTQRRWGIDINAASDAMCVVFRPGMLTSFLNQSLHEFETVWIDPVDLWMREVSNQMADIESFTFQARVTALESILIDRLKKSRVHTDPIIGCAIDLISRRYGSGSLDLLAQNLNISPRQLRRKFRFHVGMSPKQLASIERFRNATEHMGQFYPRVSLAETAHRFGYFDQSHFTRDVIRITGQSPKAFALSNRQVDQDRKLGRHFFQFVAPSPD